MQEMVVRVAMGMKARSSPQRPRRAPASASSASSASASQRTSQRCEWEVATTRCERVWRLEGEVRSVGWCPSVELDLASVVVGPKLLLLLPGSTAGARADRSRALLTSAPSHSASSEAGWVDAPSELRELGLMWQVTHVKAAYVVNGTVGTFGGGDDFGL